MQELTYKDGRIYEITTKDITGDFDVSAEISRLIKERDALVAKIQTLTGVKDDMESKIFEIK